MPGFVFLCSDRTQSDCFDRMLFGTNEKYKDQALQVRKGETGFLYNYQTKKLYAIFESTSGGKFKLVPEAWDSRFPYQVSVKWKKRYDATLDYEMLKERGLGNIAYTLRISDEQVAALEALFESTMVTLKPEPMYTNPELLNESFTFSRKPR